MERQIRRAQVLRHAKKLFARKGYHRTNISDIVSQAKIARGTFYLYFENKKELFEELLNEALLEIGSRIYRIRMGPGELSPAEQLRSNLLRVLNFMLTERELTDILLNHSLDLDREFEGKIREFYDQIIQQIQRSLDLGREMKLVRMCDTRVVAACILGGIKEVAGQTLRQQRREVEHLAEEILNFGLRGVATLELLRPVASNHDSALR
jgi:AcrR family transcriptional regulator